MAFASLALVSCQSNGVKVTVSNNSDSDCNSAIVELWADSVLSRLGSKYCYVTDSNGNEVASQHTHDGKIIFRTSIGKGSSEEYQLLPSDTLHTYPQLTAGRLYPERADDMAWENEMNGYRVYGPATQAKGERGFGYDLFSSIRPMTSFLKNYMVRRQIPPHGRKWIPYRKLTPNWLINSEIPSLIILTTAWGWIAMLSVRHWEPVLRQY